MKPYIVTHWLASLNDNFIIYLKIYTAVIIRSKDRDPSLVYIIKKFNYFSLIVILTVTLDCNFVSNS
jgi:hypothetical protein